ncbi:hypothetical protein JW979_04650, partial [bacterium]|nr:hypothetical protein [candidate division CSSED10-310 bacterium]
IAGCTVTENAASDDGGGMRCYGCGALIFDNQMISNVAEFGGALSISTSSMQISQTVFKANSAHHGGAVYNNHSYSDFKNCLYSENDAVTAGAVFFHDTMQASMINCTVADNTASDSIGGIYSLTSNPHIEYSILWGNDPPDLHASASYPTNPAMPVVRYCDIGDSFISGEHCISQDPLFTEGVLGKYYLSQIASGQDQDSMCVMWSDVSSNSICYNLPAGERCMDELTTRTDHVADQGVLDLGYHYFDDDIVKPTPTPEPTSAVTATPTPDPTPPCLELGVTIWMPANYFWPGMPCACTVFICNPQPGNLVDVPLFVILDVYGIYFFAPSFSSFDYESVTIGTGWTRFDVIPPFAWPENSGSATNIIWYAALTDMDITTILGHYDSFVFGWGDSSGNRY